MTSEQIIKRCEELDPIWQAMKEGKMCKLWDDYPDRGKIGYLTGIDFSSVLPYKTDGMWYKHAEPIKPVRRVKQPVALMQALVDGGYKPDNEGDWWCGKKLGFTSKMFAFCGKLESENSYTWRPEWLEEVNE